MLEHADIKRILPHRHPILQVDRVLELVPGKRIVATKAISGAEPCYAGLDADAPHHAHAYPVSLLVESMGQAGGVLWLHSAERAGGTLIFGSARDLTVEGAAYPGDVVRHVVELELVKGDNAFMHGESWVGDRRIASVGSILAVLRQDGDLIAAHPASVSQSPVRDSRAEAAPDGTAGTAEYARYEPVPAAPPGTTSITTLIERGL